jgi:hypothetical protein
VLYFLFSKILSAKQVIYEPENNLDSHVHVAKKFNDFLLRNYVTATLFFPNGLVNIQTVQHVSTSNKYAKNLFFFFLTLGSSGIMFANGELTPYEKKKQNKQTSNSVVSWRMVG